MNALPDSRDTLARPSVHLVSGDLFGVWVDASKHLPDAGKYVLVHLTKDNWRDSEDQAGVYFKIAKLRRGISLDERARMKAGELPDPDSHGWIAPDDQWQRVTSRRSDTYKGEDEYGNNQRPYCWKSFGPDSYWGQEVDYWMPIPPLSPNKQVGHGSAANNSKS